MKKFFFIITMLLFILILFSGCSNNSAIPPSTSTARTEAPLPPSETTPSAQPDSYDQLEADYRPDLFITTSDSPVVEYKMMNEPDNASYYKTYYNGKYISTYNPSESEDYRYTWGPTQSPTDVVVEAYDKNDKIVASAQLKDFIIYEIQNNNLNITEKYSKARSLLIINDLWDNKNIVNISSLRSLTDLEYLELHTFVDNISPIENLTNLTYLKCWGDLDLAPLKNLTKLKYLYCSSNDKADLTIIGDLSSLSALELPYIDNKTNDFTPLSKLKDLKKLNLEYSSIIDISFLKEMKNLTDLNLTACDGIEDLSPLANLTNLKHLKLYSCGGITDISPLANLVNLETLDLTLCLNINDYSPLRSLKNTEIIGADVF